MYLNYLILVGTFSSPCPCCKRVDKKKHECTHDFCEPGCPKKYADSNSPVKNNIVGSGMKDNRVSKDGGIMKKSVFAINK
jgi:hypothetical protein